MARVSLITAQDRAAIANDIQARVDELAFPELASLSNTAKNQELLEIEKTIRDYLLRLQRMSIIIDNATKGLDFDNGKSKSLNLYILYKSLLTTDMSSLLTDGYILIENLRKTFTGKEIVYEIGMEYSVSRGNKQLIEKKISLAELLSFAKVDIDWGSQGLSAFKLRARSNKNDFMSEYEKQKTLLKNEMTFTNSLYPTVMGLAGSNRGNGYEVYKQLKYEGWADHPPGPKDPSTLSPDDIAQKYAEIRKGIQSFVTGGDIGMSQIKLLSSAPSIATLTTISNALKMMLTYIEKGKNSNIIIKNIKEKVFSMEFDRMVKSGLSEFLTDVNEELSSSLNNIVS